MSDGTVVTFYSYKGGVGRTFLLANVATLLARWGYRVLAIDWDIEAPGLFNYFRDRVRKKHLYGLVDLIQRHADGKNPDWRAFTIRPNVPGTGKRLAIMPAGRQDDGYIGRVQKLEWRKLYDDHGLGRYLEDLRGEWKSEFDFVFIDSRTGVTDIGGICTVQLPDLLVFLFTANHQSLDGAIDVVKRAIEARNHLAFDRAGLLTLPVASRFDSREEYQLAETWLKTFRRRLPPFYENWIDESLEPSKILDYTRIPYFTYWSFGEKLPVVEEERSDPDSISFYLTNIAALIAHRFDQTNLLARSREAYVEEARAKTVGSAEAYDVLVSYPPEGLSFARQLVSSLKELGLSVFFDAEAVATGESFRGAAGESLRLSRNLVTLVGKTTRDSPWQTFELSYFARANEPARVIPILLAGVSSADLPPALQRWTFLSASRRKPPEIAREIFRIVQDKG